MNEQKLKQIRNLMQLRRYEVVEKKIVEDAENNDPHAVFSQ